MGVLIERRNAVASSSKSIGVFLIGLAILFCFVSKLIAKIINNFQIDKCWLLDFEGDVPDVV